MQKIKINNMTSNSGNQVANQFEIQTDEGFYFQSYDSIIVFIPNDSDEKTVLDINTWDYSRTTGKYRNIFLGESKQETEKKIKEGIYILKDLN
tara:strand:- start:4942 stop:5220 length:279 start_codon:yes stop_codon:yes gene_type:complete